MLLIDGPSRPGRSPPCSVFILRRRARRARRIKTFLAVRPGLYVRPRVYTRARLSAQQLYNSESQPGRALSVGRTGNSVTRARGRRFYARPSDRLDWYRQDGGPRTSDPIVVGIAGEKNKNIKKGPPVEEEDDDDDKRLFAAG